jgi:hypothetical protein
LLVSKLLQVQRDYEELPAESVPQLRDSLLQLLLRFGRGAPAVRTQLCLAMAALAAHLPAAQWSEGGVLRWLMERFNGQDPAVAMSCMLELLTVLPQVRCVSTVAGLQLLHLAVVTVAGWAAAAASAASRAFVNSMQLQQELQLGRNMISHVKPLQ